MSDPNAASYQDEDAFERSGYKDPSWAQAQLFAECIGRAPSLFSSCIRAINKVEAILESVDEESVRELALRSSEFLVRVSPTLKSVFYFAAESLYPDKLRATGDLNEKSVLSCFAVREVAALIALTYLYRRAQKKCDQKDWLILSRKIHTQMEIGAILGQKMSYVGIGNGLLLGGIRYISIASFAAKDPSLYQAYKKRARSGSAMFDLALEQEIFGCNHLQVASHLVQQLGFCMPRSAASMSLGMDAIAADPQTLPPKLRANLLVWKAAMAYIESFHGTGKPPEKIDVEYALKLPDEEYEELQQKIWAVVREGPTYDWLTKAPSLLPPDVAKQLRIDSQSKTAQRSARSRSVTEEKFEDDTFS